jgi:folylpolyglutamate synthase/dihydropteroate synthase
MLRPVATRFARGTILESASSSEALELAIEKTPPEGLICITGSLYLIGEMRPSILRKSLVQKHDYAT